MRDEFTNKTKDLLAKRVAFRCCFPGCGIITIGPGQSGSDDIVNLGEAAHINAASVGGPRFDEKMTNEERKSIDNGIWMCRHHARMIDSDHINHSAETISQWKRIAEEETYRLLKEPERQGKKLPTTFVAIGRNVVFEGIWKAIKDYTWTFEVHNFLFGEKNDLLGFDSKQPDNYIVVESEGDGRLIDGSIDWQFNQKYDEISIKVQSKTTRTMPYLLSDLSIGEDMDLEFENGDLKMVTGEDCAKQKIMMALSTNFGDMWYSPSFGSFFSMYYWTFKDKPEILKKLIKLEITRILSVPPRPTTDKFGIPALDLENDNKPALGFINRIISVDIISHETQDEKIMVHIRLEWGDGKHWEDKISIFITPKNEIRGKFPKFNI